VAQLHDDDGAHGEEEELQRQHLDPPLSLHSNESPTNQSIRLPQETEGVRWVLVLVHRLAAGSGSRRGTWHGTRGRGPGGTRRTRPAPHALEPKPIPVASINSITASLAYPGGLVERRVGGDAGSVGHRVGRGRGPHLGRAGLRRHGAACHRRRRSPGPRPRRARGSDSRGWTGSSTGARSQRPRHVAVGCVCRRRHGRRP
jgi:hypothetical protein